MLSMLAAVPAYAALSSSTAPKPNAYKRSDRCALRLSTYLGSGMRLWGLAIFFVTVSIGLLYLFSGWQGFALASLVPYLISVSWGLPFARIGSWKSLVSIIHRFSGVGSLMLPILLAAYETLTSRQPSDIFFILAVVCLTFNCVFGAILIPRRIPSFDVPTIRAFAVGVTLGLSFVGLALMWRFGHHRWYQPIGIAFGVFSVYSTCLAWIDSIRHIIGHNSKVYYRNLPKLDYFDPVCTARDVGLKNKPYGLVSIFTTSFLAPPDPRLLKVTITPSSAAVVYTTTMTAVFALTSLIQVHYIRCGHSAMLVRHELYPTISQASIYLALLAGVANNFGTFAGTLVVQKKVSIFWGSFFNAIGLLIPLLASLVLQLRVGGDENLLSSTFLQTCTVV